MTMRSVSLVTVLACLVMQPVLAQQPEGSDPRRVYMSRDDLRELLNRLELAENSAAYSSSLRGRARLEASLIRTRLNEGDFQTGDRILLVVQGEPTLTDTFTVAEGRILDLPDIGDVPLAGVLRAELEPYLVSYISRYIRDPTVRTRSLMPITILGGVLQPGFYTVPSQMLLPDVLMVAGGPTQLAKITEIRVERGNSRIWQAEHLQDAITAGRTLDQLNLLAGDRIVIPAQAPAGSTFRLVRTVAAILAVPLTIAGLVALF